MSSQRTLSCLLRSPNLYSSPSKLNHFNPSLLGLFGTVGWFLIDKPTKLQEGGLVTEEFSKALSIPGSNSSEQAGIWKEGLWGYIWTSLEFTEMFSNPWIKRLQSQTADPTLSIFRSMSLLFLVEKFSKHLSSLRRDVYLIKTLCFRPTIRLRL